MFPKDSHTGFGKYPQRRKEQTSSSILFPFTIEIVERLLHRFQKPLPVSLWIQR